MKKNLILTIIISLGLMIMVGTLYVTRYNGEYYLLNNSFAYKMTITSNRSTLQVFSIKSPKLIKTVKKPFSEEEKVYSDPELSRIEGYNIKISLNTITIEGLGEGRISKENGVIIITDFVEEKSGKKTWLSFSDVLEFVPNLDLDGYRK